MRRLLTGLLLIVPLTAFADDLPAGRKDGLKIGGDLPGEFVPYNATGPYKGRYHSLISEYDLAPVVMLIVRDFDANDALKDLLKQLDERIDKNPTVRMHAFAVFLTDERTDVLGDDDKREDLARKLQDLSNGLMLKNVVLSMDNPKDLQKYPLGDAWAVAVLYRKYRVEAVYSLPKSDGKAEVEKIMADVGTKLRANKTK